MQILGKKVLHKAASGSLLESCSGATLWRLEYFTFPYFGELTAVTGAAVQQGKRISQLKNPPKKPKPTKQGKSSRQCSVGILYPGSAQKGIFWAVNREFWWNFVFRNREVATNICSPLTPTRKFCKPAIFYTTSLTKVFEGENCNSLGRIFLRALELPEKGFHFPPPWIPCIFHETSPDLFSEYTEVIR